MKTLKTFFVAFFILTASFFSYANEPQAEPGHQSYETVEITDSANTSTLNQTVDNKEVNEESAIKYTSLPHEGITFMGIVRALIGLTVLLGILVLFSENRKAIAWKTVGIGLGLQILLAICIQKVPFVSSFFEFISRIFVKVLDFSKAGGEFLFGGLMNSSSFGFIFAFQILPTIIFFSALTSVLFYLGIIQKVVGWLAKFMTKLMGISGAESLSVAGNIFLGQTEAPLMIKPYLQNMNRSEIFLVMVGGMSTLAGGVLAAYISFLGGDDPVARQQFAKLLLMASVMAAPGAIIAAKILVPQSEKVSTEVKVSMDKIGSNFLDSMTNGAGEGLKLAANVAAMLLVFVAFIAMINWILIKTGDITHLNGLLSDWTGGKITNLSLQTVLGVIFYPVIAIIGTPLADCLSVGGLLGQKIVASEFVAYIDLQRLLQTGGMQTQKAIIMATVILSGFANVASIGIQIGGIGSLAPAKRTLLSQLGMRALLAGTFASLFSATIVGGLLG